MEQWPHRSLVSAVTSMVEEAERCGSCGLSDEQRWSVAAELHLCPTCEDRDRESARAPEGKNRAGWRVRFRHLLTQDERDWESSASRYTIEGATRRHRLQRQR